MSYAKGRLSNSVENRTFRIIFGILTTPLLLLASAGALVAL
jgi:hypothetical protein